MLLRNEFHKTIAIDRIINLDLSKKPYIFSLRPVRKIRNLSQNRLYWANIGLFVFELAGGDQQMKDVFHYTFKESFIRFEDEVNEENRGNYAIIFRKRKIVKFGDREVKECYSTTDLDTKQFAKYLDLIYQFAKDFEDFRLLDPKDKEFEKMIQFYEQYI
jgi:hypothetical protein